MKEITQKDLNMGLLGKRTKKGLIEMICHVANISNSYTSPGDALMGDRVLSKLNLVRDRFKIRTKPVPAPAPVPRPPLKAGDTVKIIRSSVYWAPGKVGTLVAPSEGGWTVQVNFKDSFGGDLVATDHTIWASEVELFTPNEQQNKEQLGGS